MMNGGVASRREKEIEEESYENRIFHVCDEGPLADKFQPNLTSSEILLT